MDNDSYVYNATDKTVRTKAFGNYLSFGPLQYKRCSSDIGNFLRESRKDLGLVGLPEEFEDPQYALSEAGIAVLAEKKREGIANRCRHLEGIVQNLKSSLAQDLAKAEMNIDPFVLASKGEMEAMEELVSYQHQAGDESKLKVENLRKLERQLHANSSGMINKKA